MTAWFLCSSCGISEKPFDARDLGDGEQDRNFTYVQDMVDTMILVAEKMEGGIPINAGRDGPKISYREGFKRTIEWYFANKNREEVKTNLEKLLIER